MNRPPLPELRDLTDDQKNELIVSLWETLVATEEHASAPSDVARTTPATPTLSDLRDRIRAMPSRRTPMPAAAHTRLGSGLGLLDSKLLLGVLVVIGVAFLADFGVSWYQRRALEARNHATLELENAAFGGLYVELVHIDHDADGKSYRATIAMRNSNPDAPLYIMLDPVRAFEQTGLTWQEVPARAPNGGRWSVVKLDGGGQYQVVFQADAKDWAELIPGYMHVRIDSHMLISRGNEPRDDIVERGNNFYVYLKPQGADDAAIKRRSNFPGTPPIFIPMPPH